MINVSTINIIYQKIKTLRLLEEIVFEKNVKKKNNKIFVYKISITFNKFILKQLK